MAVKEKDFSGAKGFTTFLRLCLWIIIVLGFLGMFASLAAPITTEAVALINTGAAISCAILILSGVVSLAVLEVADATFRTAEINWRMLGVMEQSASQDQNTHRKSSAETNAASKFDPKKRPWDPN